MLVFNTGVFDEIITGTTVTWYSSDAFNKLLGQADFFTFVALATNVSTPAPSLNVYIDLSADNRNWIQSTTPDLSIPTVTENAMALGSAFDFVLSFVRLRITLGGTSPQCRLQLNVTGRDIAL